MIYLQLERTQNMMYCVLPRDRRVVNIDSSGLMILHHNERSSLINLKQFSLVHFQYEKHLVVVRVLRVVWSPGHVNRPKSSGWMKGSY